MKRLLRISFNQAIFSFIPIISWIILGLILDKKLANVFTLTYPLQFIWTIFRSIFATGANISKEKFNYKEHRRNAYKLLGVLLFTTFAMTAFSYRHYELNLVITLMYLSVEIINFLIYPLYELKVCYLQLTDKFERKVTSNKVVESGMRVITSFLKTPFCTAIGQTFSMIEQYVVVNIIFYRNFRIDKNGKVVKISKV